MRENVMPLSPKRFVLLLATTLLASPLAARAAAPDSANASPPSSADVLPNPPVPRLFTKGDLVFLGGTIAGVTLAVLNDQWLTDRAVEAERNKFQQNVAEIFQPLGRTQYLLAGAAAVYGAGRLMHQDRLARRATRIAVAVTIASAASVGLKRVTGRERPEDSPHQSENFKPFQGGNSFPSGHATTAFAAAAALDRETDSRWVPYLAYPAATLVAWSRVHDHKHWTSDVVAGAALGGWMAWKTETFLSNRALGVPDRNRKEDAAEKSKKGALMLVPHDGAMAIVWVRRFE